MSPTTRQLLEAEPELAYFIDESNEVKKWGANPGSTEERPVVDIEVYESIEVRYVAPAQ